MFSEKNNKENFVTHTQILNLLKDDFKNLFEIAIPEFSIKNGDTLLISGEMGFRKNINSKYLEIFHYIEKNKDKFKNYDTEVEGGGVSVELVTPIGEIKKVIICIEKDH